MTPRAKRPWRELEDVERAHAKRMRPWTGIAPLGGLSVYGVPRLQPRERLDLLRVGERREGDRQQVDAGRVTHWGGGLWHRGIDYSQARSASQLSAVSATEPCATIPLVPEQEHSASHVALGRAIRELREKRGLSQAALAERAGIDPSYQSGLERGRRNPSWSVIVALAEALEVSPEKLVAAASRFE